MIHSTPGDKEIISRVFSGLDVDAQLASCPIHEPWLLGAPVFFIWCHGCIWCLGGVVCQELFCVEIRAMISAKLLFPDLLDFQLPKHCWWDREFSLSDDPSKFH